MTPPTPADVTCRGAALLAAVGLGRFPSIEAAAATVHGERVISPRSDRVAALAARRRSYARLYPALRDLLPQPDHPPERTHGHHP